jgi:hypothetical protein
MTMKHELFTGLLEINADLHVDLDTHLKCSVEGIGTVRFQLELEVFLEVENMLYVLDLRKNLILVSALEDKGYIVLFQEG